MSAMIVDTYNIQITRKRIKCLLPGDSQVLTSSLEYWRELTGGGNKHVEASPGVNPKTVTWYSDTFFYSKLVTEEGKFDYKAAAKCTWYQRLRVRPTTHPHYQRGPSALVCYM